MNDKTIYPTALEARVAARNARNQFICDTMPTVLEVLRKFIGKKVRISGGLSAKLAKALLEAFPNTRGLYFRSSLYGNSITAHFQREAQYAGYHGSLTTYSEEVVYIGEYGADGLLEKVGGHAAGQYRTNYSADEIIEARREVQKAREALYRAERLLCGFGEHDNNA